MTRADSGTFDATGFSLLELLVALAVTMTLAAAVLDVMRPVLGQFHAEPEAIDGQQRLRAACSLIATDLGMAGAGMYAGASPAGLDAFMAAVVPRRVGRASPDVAGSFHASPRCPTRCASAVTIAYVPPTAAQTTIESALAAGAADTAVSTRPGCPAGSPTCGFSVGTRVAVLDQDLGADVYTVTNIAGSSLHLEPRDVDARAHVRGLWMTEVISHTYYLEDDGVTTFRLREFDGYKSDLPLIDDVVDFRVELLGDPLLPQVLRPASATVPAAVTYGPAPPRGEVAVPPWPAGENCLFTVDDSGRQVPRPELAPEGAPGGPFVPLPAARLVDGPWCPSGAAGANRYDADLLRVRQVRVTLRVQAASAVFRGPAGSLFLHGGSARVGDRYVPDLEVHFDVTPRNLNRGTLR